MMAYEPRLTEPSASDLRWIMQAYGGYNICIPGSNGPPSVLPNCTGYVHGRTMEIAGVTTDNLGLPNTNAVDYYDNASSDWIRDGGTPSLGAVGVYSTIGSYQPGHVLIVEEIIDNDTIVISQSDYGGNRFSVYTIYRAYDWAPWATGWGVTFRGFLRNPYADSTPPAPPGSTAAKLAMLHASIRKRREVLKNVRYKRNSRII